MLRKLFYTFVTIIGICIVWFITQTDFDASRNGLFLPKSAKNQKNYLKLFRDPTKRNRFKNSSNSDAFDETKFDRQVKWMKILSDTDKSVSNKTSICILLTMKLQKTQRRLPDVVGIGVEKCGSTALIEFIRHHPSMVVPPGERAEVHYFDMDPLPPVSLYYRKLPKVTPHQLVMEKSPAYFNFPPFLAPKRMKRIVPEAKLVLIVCDPVYRVFSDISQEKAMEVLDHSVNASSFIRTSLRELSFIRDWRYLSDEEVNQSIEDYISSYYASHIFLAGIYYYPLSKWLKYYPREQILILDGENFIDNPGRQVERLQEFLNIPKLLIESDFKRNRVTNLYCIRLPWWKKQKCMDHTKGRTRKKTQYDPKAIRLLSNFYKHYNEKFYDLAEEDFGWT